MPEIENPWELIAKSVQTIKTFNGTFTFVDYAVAIKAMQLLEAQFEALQQYNASEEFKEVTDPLGPALVAIAGEMGFTLDAEDVRILEERANAIARATGALLTEEIMRMLITEYHEHIIHNRQDESDLGEEDES